MLDLYYSNMQKGTPKFRATLACCRMLLVPPLIKELGKLTAVGDVYLETSADPRVYDFEGIGLEIMFRRASLGVCSCRNATDRDALLVSGNFDIETVLNADKEIDDASIKLQVDSIEASYNVLSSDTSVRLVSPFSTQLALLSSRLKAVVSGLRCCLDVRDMPVVAGCLKRLSVRSCLRDEKLFLFLRNAFGFTFSRSFRPNLMKQKLTINQAKRTLKPWLRPPSSSLPTRDFLSPR